MALTIKLFSGEWCPSCKPREQFIGDLCIRKDFNLDLVKLEDRAARAEAALFHIKAIPMVLVLDGDNVLVQFGPTVSEDRIIKWLEERMSFDAEHIRETTTDEGSSDVPRERG